MCLKYLFYLTRNRSRYHLKYFDLPTCVFLNIMLFYQNYFFLTLAVQIAKRINVLG